MSNLSFYDNELNKDLFAIIKMAVGTEAESIENNIIKSLKYEFDWTKYYSDCKKKEYAIEIDGYNKETKKTKIYTIIQLGVYDNANEEWEWMNTLSFIKNVIYEKYKNYVDNNEEFFESLLQEKIKIKKEDRNIIPYFIQLFLFPNSNLIRAIDRKDKYEIYYFINLSMELKISEKFELSLSIFDMFSSMTQINNTTTKKPKKTTKKLGRQSIKSRSIKTRSTKTTSIILSTNKIYKLKNLKK